MVHAADLIDLKNATQSRLVFWDEQIYQQELERIFARSWLFLTPENFIPKPGDFMTTFMGEDRVVVARGPDGKIAAFLNSCTHRGNQMVNADRGTKRNFVCNYHGWTFGPDGKLINVPLETRCYHDDLDKSKLNARQVRVESYRGLVFGCWDPEAPSLVDYLGDMAWYLDTFLVGAGGGIEVLGPPMRSRLKCNWKIPCENFVGDAYHVGWTHAGALKILGGELAGLSGNNAQMPYDDLGLQFTTRHGHGFGVIDNAAQALHGSNPGYYSFLESTKAEVGRRLGAPRERLYTGHWNSCIFPNTTFLYGTNTFKTWHPHGPHELEVWTWSMVHKDMDSETKCKIQHEAIRTFGTAGTFESDDGDNFGTVTHSNRGAVARRGRMNSAMGLNREGPHPDYPGIVGASFIGETSYRGYYRFWMEMMDASDWPAIRANDANWSSIWTNEDFWKNRVTEPVR